MSNAWTPTDALGLGGAPDDVVKQLYGYMGWAIDDPELIDPDTGINVIQEAAAGGWSPDMLRGALAKTSFWKTKSDAERNWENELNTDKASAMAKVAQQADTIRSELVQQGVNLDDNTINNIAQESLRFGWSDSQTKLALDAELQRSPSVLASKVGTDYKALAQQYAVPLSDATLQQWSAHSIAGNTSDEQFRQYLVTQAKQRFGDPTLGKFLDAGGTVDQFYDPYKNIASQTLGIDPNTIDLSDPKWSSALQGRDQKTGELRVMTYDEWNQYLKGNDSYGWQNTNDAKQQAQGLVDQIGKAFGKEAA